MMKSIYLLTVGFFTVLRVGFSQNTDSIILKISNIVNDNSLNVKFNLSVLNSSSEPICILHSSYIDVREYPFQKIELLKKADNRLLYSLLYSERDQKNDYELENDNFNGELVLPGQHAVIGIQIPVDTTAERVLYVDVLLVPDFCFKKFRKDVFAFPTQWYKKYRRKRYELAIK